MLLGLRAARQPLSLLGTASDEGRTVDRRAADKEQLNPTPWLMLISPSQSIPPSRLLLCQAQLFIASPLAFAPRCRENQGIPFSESAPCH